MKLGSLVSDLNPLLEVANPLHDTPCLCVISMIVVSLAAAAIPVHRVNVRNGSKILQRLVELNFECRHFYTVFPLVGLSPFSAVTTAGTTTGAAPPFPLITATRLVSLDDALMLIVIILTFFWRHIKSRTRRRVQLILCPCLPHLLPLGHFLGREWHLH